MASDGSQFTLLIPLDKMVFEGSNTVKEKSTNPLLNLLLQFFLDAIAVRGLDPGNEYMVAGDSETIEDAARKHLYIEQEYTLTVMQPKAGPEKLPRRVITFHRGNDMLPLRGLLPPHLPKMMSARRSIRRGCSSPHFSQASIGAHICALSYPNSTEGCQLRVGAQHAAPLPGTNAIFCRHSPRIHITFGHSWGFRPGSERRMQGDTCNRDAETPNAYGLMGVCQ